MNTFLTGSLKPEDTIKKSKFSRGKDTKNYQVNRLVGLFEFPTILDAVELEELINLFNEGITETAKILFVRQLVIRRIMAEDVRMKYRAIRDDKKLSVINATDSQTIGV